MHLDHGSSRRPALRVLIAVLLVLAVTLLPAVSASSAPRRLQIVENEIDRMTRPAYRAAGGPAVPANSGSGRRVVYGNGAQRVWAVESDGTVVRTYLVSGRAGVPRPGTYSVYSRSRMSSSGSLALPYMVRFARGSSLAIGFHQIPVRPNGTMIQSLSQLGTYRSAGCVRQAPADAAFMWEFGQIGTKVVVLP